MVEMDATNAMSATVTESPATQAEDPKKTSNNASESWIFFSLSSLFGTPAKMYGYCEIIIKKEIFSFIPYYSYNNE